MRVTPLVDIKKGGLGSSWHDRLFAKLALDEAREMGAHDTINSRDPEAIKAAAGRFDLRSGHRSTAFEYLPVTCLQVRHHRLVPGRVLPAIAPSRLSRL